MHKMALFFLFSTSLAQASLSELVSNAHLRVNDSMGIACEYTSETPKHFVREVDESYLSDSHVWANFIVNENSFQVRVDADGKIQLISSVGEKIQAKLKTEKYKGYKVKMLKFDESSSQFASEINLANLKCWVEMATEKVQKIDTAKVHINVHPYFGYDYLGLTKASVEESLFNQDYKQLILLDDYYHKASLFDPVKFIAGGGSWLKNKKLNLIELEIPEDVKLLVSPAGHNSYKVSSEVLDVLYTGGNHNYCMLNNSARLIEAFVKGEGNSELHFSYKTDAIVVQKRTFAQDLSIPRKVIRKSNVLSRMFEDAKFAKEYHEAYFNYFAGNRILWFKSFYKSVTFKYHSSHFSKELVIEGTGEKELIISMNYL